MNDGSSQISDASEADSPEPTSSDNAAMPMVMDDTMMKFGGAAAAAAIIATVGMALVGTGVCLERNRS